MNSFRFARSPDRSPLILFIGAHCDDIELGCGGTILKLRASMPSAELHWVVLSSDEERRRETLRSASCFLGDRAAERVRLEAFRDGFFPSETGRLKEFFESLKPVYEPDLIFTHHAGDLHQDHREVAQLTWNTWRNHTILEYEIPKYDGDLGRPNAFVSLSRAVAEQKVSALLEAYSSQGAKDWFDADTLYAVMRLRGVESRAPERYAEAFHARKLVIDL